MIQYLKDKNIGYNIYYPLPLHQQECFEHYNYKNKEFPVSIKAAKETLALPIFPDLSKEEQRYVVDALNNF